MEVFVVCNTGYEEKEFLCAFSTLEKAMEYASKKWGDFDNIVVFKHVIDSKETGMLVHRTNCSFIRIKS
jgi:hypothetical protein